MRSIVPGFIDECDRGHVTLHGLSCKICEREIDTAVREALRRTAHPATQNAKAWGAQILRGTATRDIFAARVATVWREQHA